MMDPTVPTEEEFDPKGARSSLAFRTILNPRIWHKGQVRPEVRLRLLRAAIAFYKFLDVPGLVVEDIVLTGSNCGFTYTPASDIDVHLIVDYARSTCPDLAADFFDTKRTLWNTTHRIEIRGHIVEMYVEDAADPARSSGIHSLLKGNWLARPSATPPERHDGAVIAKAGAIAAQIEALLHGNPQPADIDALTRRLREMRSSGLMDGGEFSTENLAYKVLRAQGYLDRLRMARIASQDRDLSI